MPKRTNEEWLADLRSDAPDDALSDLRAVLLRGLNAALSDRGDVATADLEDFAQDALLKIMASLDSFRGESRFTTWAQKISVRVAFTELRRMRWRDWSLDRMIDGEMGDKGDFTPAILVDPAHSPEEQAVQRTVMDAVQSTLSEKLTDRQRIALMAVKVEGAPLEEVARRMGTNRNALYKLLYDARQRLSASWKPPVWTPTKSWRLSNSARREFERCKRGNINVAVH